MAIDTFDSYGAEHTAGSVSVDGCVINVPCDLCEGDDFCAHGTPIAYGDGWFELVSRYQARRSRGWQFPSLSEPFSLKTLPVYPLAIP